MMKNNFIGQLLLGALVFLLLLSSAQMFGWGQGISPVILKPEDAETLPSIPKVSKPTEEITVNDKKVMMQAIYSRPMFSLTREPFKVVEETDDSDANNEPISELKAQLKGVVITPEQSYATILDTQTNESQAYKVGMPLAGEQGGWTLNSIQSRKVVFVSDDDKTEELELEVYSGALKSTATHKKGKTNAVVKKAGNNNAAKPQSKADKKRNADDIRRKIAERRAQMRAEAAKKK